MHIAQAMPQSASWVARQPERPCYDVVIPCYNRAHTLEAAVDSVLAQATPPARVVLVDDGSSDATADLLLALERRHATVCAVTLPRNAGASAARNAGLALARAPWVAFLDSDDVWTAGAADALLHAAADVDVVVGHFRRAWPDGAIDPPECGWSAGDVRDALALGGAIGPSWSIVRRSAAMAVGGFDPSFHNCNDWDFFVRLVANGARFVRIPATIALYRVVESNRLSRSDAIGAANARRVMAHPLFARVPMAVAAQP
jgi:glycosyltransferase involved in cell wall biosynthesis